MDLTPLLAHVVVTQARGLDWRKFDQGNQSLEPLICADFRKQRQCERACSALSVHARAAPLGQVRGMHDWRGQNDAYRTEARRTTIAEWFSLWLRVSVVQLLDLVAWALRQTCWSQRPNSQTKGTESEISTKRSFRQTFTRQVNEFFRSLTRIASVFSVPLWFNCVF